MDDENPYAPPKSFFLTDELGADIAIRVEPASTESCWWCKMERSCPTDA